MKNKRVAICISCYNHEPFVEQCIKSVQEQTYRNFILFFWDNNSTDDSYEVAFKASKHKIDVCTMQHFGIYKVLPIGIARWLMVDYVYDCSHIAIIDADDYWHPKKLEKQMKLFDDPEVKLVFSDCYYHYWDEQWTQIGGFPVFCKKPYKIGIGKETFHDRYKPHMTDPFIGLLTYGNFMSCPTLVFEREALIGVIGNPMHYTSAEDYDWILKMTAKYKAAYVPEPLAYYRIHKDQLTQKTPARNTMEEIDVVKRAMHFRPLTKAERRRVYRHLVYLYMKLCYKEVREWKRERDS